MRRKPARKLELHRETLREITAPALRRIGGGCETHDGDCTQVDSYCPIGTCTCCCGAVLEA